MYVSKRIHLIIKGSKYWCVWWAHVTNHMPLINRPGQSPYGRRFVDQEGSFGNKALTEH